MDYFENSRRATYVKQQYAIRNPKNLRDYGQHTGGSRRVTAQGRRHAASGE
jgi:hypothetical protein